MWLNLMVSSAITLFLWIRSFSYKRHLLWFDLVFNLYVLTSTPTLTPTPTPTLTQTPILTQTLTRI